MKTMVMAMTLMIFMMTSCSSYVEVIKKPTYTGCLVIPKGKYDHEQPKESYIKLNLVCKF